MVRIVLGVEGDEMIIVKSGDVYMLESYYCGAYYCTFASYDYGEVLQHYENCNPKF